MKLRTLSISALLALGVSMPAIASAPTLQTVDENGLAVAWTPNQAPILFSNEVSAANIQFSRTKYIQTLADYVTNFSDSGFSNVEYSNLVSLVETICRADNPEEYFKMLLAKLGWVQCVHRLSAEVGENTQALWTLLPLANGAYDLLEKKLDDLVAKLGDQLRGKILISELELFRNNFGEELDPGIYGRDGKWATTADALYYVLSFNSSIPDALQRVVDTISRYSLEVTGATKLLRSPKFFTDKNRVLACLDQIGLAYFVHQTAEDTDTQENLDVLMGIPLERLKLRAQHQVRLERNSIHKKLTDLAESREISLMAGLQASIMANSPVASPALPVAGSSSNDNNNNTSGDVPALSTTGTDVVVTTPVVVEVKDAPVDPLSVLVPAGTGLSSADSKAGSVSSIADMQIEKPEVLDQALAGHSGSADVSVAADNVQKDGVVPACGPSEVVQKFDAVVAQVRAEAAPGSASDGATVTPASKLNEQLDNLDIVVAEPPKDEMKDDSSDEGVADKTDNGAGAPPAAADEVGSSQDAGSVAASEGNKKEGFIAKLTKGFKGGKPKSEKKAKKEKKQKKNGDEGTN